METEVVVIVNNTLGCNYSDYESLTNTVELPFVHIVSWMEYNIIVIATCRACYVCFNIKVGMIHRLFFDVYCGGILNDEYK